MMDEKLEAEETEVLIIICIYAEAAPSFQMIPMPKQTRPNSKWGFAS